MGIPKKGSRSTDHNGVEYNFIVKETNVPDHKDQKELQVTVQVDSDRPGAVMQFRAMWGVPITRALVTRAIGKALKEGWKPDIRGSAFTIEIEV